MAPETSREGASSLYAKLPISTEYRQIRVLDLLAGLRGSPVRCRLRVTTLNKAEPYQALSYTWGKSLDGRSITVYAGDDREPQVLPVTDNLFRALCGLRPRFGRPRHLWVDAICINQRNDAEKGAQVRLMGGIYGAAERVNVWLGDPAALTLYGDGAQHQMRVRPWRERHAKYRSGSYISVPRLNLAFWLPVLFTDRLRRLLDALTATEPPWTGRVWVTQEYVLAKRIYFCFGYEETRHEHSMLYEVLGMCKEKVNDDGVPLDSPLKALGSRCSDLDRFQSKHIRGGRRQACLTDILNVLGFAEASDPRDFVYAMLGIMDPVHAQLVVPRYNDDVWKVYADATYATIMSTGALEILRFAGDRPACMRGLPSWVPDLSARAIPDFFESLNKRVVRWPVGEHNVAQHSLSQDSSKLTVAGTTFSTVSNCIHLVRRMHVTFTLATKNSQIFPKDRRSLIELLLSPAQRERQSLDDRDCHLRRMQDIRIIQASTSPQSPNLLAFEVMAESIVFDGLVEAVFKEWTNARAKWPNARAKWPINARHPDFAKYDFDMYWPREFESAALIRLQNGLVGIADCKAQAGDLVVLPELRSMPLLLRRRGERYRFCGFAYIHGIMNEELLELWAGCEIEVESYTLV
jgi:hypothetical protein